MNNIVFRRMTKADIEGVVAVENQSFTTPWSAKAFLDEMRNDLAYYLVAVVDNKIVAYAGAWIILDEAHITNVAVAKEYRKQAIGQKLMIEMIDLVKAKGVTSMTLEVRPSNVGALALYNKLNFIKVGIRKNYYDLPSEDAIIMWLKNI